jgi:hypothetical protein
MKETNKEPVPCNPREPLLREEEQYATCQYNSPPVPPFATLVPRGMIGYEERKQEERREATRDRKTAKKSTEGQTQTQVQRWAVITRLACAFPQIGVQRIAEDVVPWDMEEFKKRVAEAEAAYRESMLSSGVK